LVDTIILAGGKSSRFTRNKLAEIYQGKPLIYYTIKTFLTISESVIIVTGHYDLDYLSDFLQNSRIKIVHNTNYEKGMFTSVLKGALHVTNDFFLIPGDYPLVKPSTLQHILKSDGQIRVPTYQHQRGHPIFITKDLLPTLLKEPETSNLKVFRDRHIVNYIPVDDEGILKDIDSLADLQDLPNERMDSNETSKL